NVREEPTTQSKILYKIEEGLGGILEITDNPNWYKVIYSKEGGGVYPDKNNFIKGWIHKSRVCFDPGWYGWKKGDPQVCKD
ncbi:MAG: SH3 domain-containing protein, partial [Prevotellaceae bacterium]|nr:SH3 domain-containing protein [Prevotellaceae bacterium]